MGDILLIYNERSGSYDPAVLDAIKSLFDDAGRPVRRTLSLEEGLLPTAGAMRIEGVELVVILSGDGSINAIANMLEGWDGTILALPGGTMNLLARALHGELAAPDIVSAYLAGEGEVIATPVLRAGDMIAYTGMIVGPTAAWGDVREDVRNLDVAALGESIPRALSATLDSSAVTMAGCDQEFPAIFLEPARSGIRAQGILAEGAADLFRHGWAWLSGDFREGPSQSLGVAQEMTFSSNSGELDLLVDGEKADAPDPLAVRADVSAVRFYAAQGDAAWL